MYEDKISDVQTCCTLCQSSDVNIKFKKSARLVEMEHYSISSLQTRFRCNLEDFGKLQCVNYCSFKYGSWTSDCFKIMLKGNEVLCRYVAEYPKLYLLEVYCENEIVAQSRSQIPVFVHSNILNGNFMRSEVAVAFNILYSQSERVDEPVVEQSPLQTDRLEAG
ncbi:hypothetical protein PoB_000816800 [Plakobranchus ocellatus]|uniref:Uncharacterized protein n=1 Tax=Plakobranchus ocellatus TaxID=259542 RepID=A0AAV3YGK5_9GAST|nr:hypothetical protein PoB_000816800 [Plakobranchus ocellatus]